MSKNKFILKFFAVCIAFCALCPLISGCTDSNDWVKNTILKYYYRFDGDYSDLENMSGLTVQQMVEKLDAYSAYYTREEYEQVLADNDGNKSGVGVSFAYENGVVLHSVIGNSPAKKAGLKAGDVLVSGKTAAGEEVRFTSSTAFSDFVSARAEGENFWLTLDNGMQVTLAKAEYTASYACMYTHDHGYEIEYDGVRRVVKTDYGIPQLPAGTAYIYLYQFFGGAADEIAALIEQFNAEGCTSLILDLRDNGGGYVKLMAEIGGRFTSLGEDEEHVAMIARYKDGTEEITKCPEYDLTERDPQRLIKPGTNVYVMANHNTASASEALIGVLVSYDILKYENIFLSKYQGQDPKSYGKGIMQTTYTNLLTGEALKLTVAGIYWAKDNKTIHGVGLTPQDGCSVAEASDMIVNVGYDDELIPVIQKITADAQ